MYSGYFNHYNHIAEGYWDRRSFLGHWWRINRGDARWAPPYYPKLFDAIVRRRSPYMAKLRPKYIHMLALPDNRKPNEEGLPKPSTALFETTTGACAVLCDPRRKDGTAYLGLLHCVNDLPSLKRFLNLAIDCAGQLGYHRLVGPTGLSPHLQYGVLMDHFHLTPPLHSPYNPPYVPEIVQGALRPYRASHLYHVDVASAEIENEDAVVFRVRHHRGEEIAHELAPLFQRVFDEPDGFPKPDEDETAFILDWLSVWPLDAYIAYVSDAPVGYALLQPDFAPAVARARGGRNPLWRSWLALRSRYPTRDGRLLYGGVLPDYRRRGIASQLWRHVLLHAQSAGWETLNIGPVSFANVAGAFLAKQGAVRRQTYRLFATEL